MAYRSDQDKIRRQRMLAQMLQQGGMSPVQQQSVGGMPVPTPKWSGVNQIAQTALGLWGEHRADKQEGDLEQRRQTEVQDWITSMPETRQEQLAWALKGQDFGETGAALGNAVASRALTPEDPLMKAGKGIYNRETGEWLMPPGGSDREVLPPSLKDFTPESIATWTETGDYNDLDRWSAGKTIKGSDGLDYTFDPATSRYIPMAVSPLPGSTPEGQPSAGAAKPQSLADVASSQAAIAGAVAGAKADAESAADPRPKLTPAQEAVDKAYAKDYNEFIAQGGIADIEKNLGQLGQVKKALEGGTDSATGPMVGLMPKFARDIFTPEGAALQDSVEEVVQRNLRLILGAQFTEKEGTRLIERAYNPKLQEEENAKRIDRLINQMGSAARAKMEAAKYYEENGTLQGFKGKTSFSIDDFDPDAGGRETEGSSEAVPLDQADPDSHYDALPPGTLFIAPDGTTRRKP